MLPDARTVAARHANPADLGVLECASLLQARLLSPSEFRGLPGKVAKRNGGPPTFDGGPDVVNAWVRLYERARPPPQRRWRPDGSHVRRSGRAGRAAPPLCGVPLALKDLYAVAGKPLTASSHVLDGNVAVGDTTVWERLGYAGMVLVGHTAHARVRRRRGHRPGRQPVGPLAQAGGSSGGSGAALSARMVPAATGTDTGGSLRMPSSVCGTSTIKPTIGRVSTHGVVPLASRWTTRVRWRVRSPMSPCC